MFRLKTSNEKGLEAQIDAILASMMVPNDKHGPEYQKLIESLNALYALKEKEVSPRERISVNALLGVIGTLVGIGTIVGYERAHVLTSKALSLLSRSPKI